jgi:hypothetical protein
VRRPRYVLLSVLAAAVTSAFAAAYVNSDLERYFLVPVFVAFTFVGLGLADAVSLGVWLVDAATETRPLPASAASRPPPPPPAADGRPREAGADDDFGRMRAGARRCSASRSSRPWCSGGERDRRARASELRTEPIRRGERGRPDRPGHLDAAVLAPPDQGGLPANAVIVSNWSDSTTLWYGQRVEGLRPDVYIVDDRTRLDDNLGEVWDVIDSYLGHRPVFLLRFPWNLDGMDKEAPRRYLRHARLRVHLQMGARSSRSSARRARSASRQVSTKTGTTGSAGPRQGRRAVVLLPCPQRGSEPRGAGRGGPGDAALAGRKFEIIAVDDGSKDRTPAIADELASDIRTSSASSTTPPTYGYGAALRSGFRASRYDLIAFIDGDRQFKVIDVGRLTERMAAADSPDVVVGYRLKRADPPIRRWYARIYRLSNRIFFGVRVRDIDCACKLFKRRPWSRSRSPRAAPSSPPSC